MTTGTTGWSKANKIGLVLLALCGVANLIPAPPGEPGTPGPPQSIIIADIVLGIAIIVAVILAFRTNSRRAAWLASGAAILSVLSAVPAFFVDEVPISVRALVAVFAAVAVLAVALTLSKSKQ
ncbi:MAG TPA: hypothetical protein VM093_08340 [Aeromicrobium sp.]|nr:hypothetical protein [Aeromicrobium sp.]